MQPHDLFARHGEQAERIGLAQMRLLGEGKLREVRQVLQIVRMDARLLEAAAVEGHVLIGVAQRPTSCRSSCSAAISSREAISIGSRSSRRGVRSFMAFPQSRTDKAATSGWVGGGGGGLVGPSGPLQHQRDALADADAHRAERAAPRRARPSRPPPSAPAARRTCRADGRARSRRRSGSRARHRPAGRAGASRPAPARRTPRSVRSGRHRRSSAPAARAAFPIAGAGPMPMMRGGTPAVAIAGDPRPGVSP